MEDCDRFILHELARSGIKPLEIERTTGEVPYSFVGTLGDIRFTRAWRYWMVKCKIPLAVAEALYADPVGKGDVRVAGHAGAPSPKEWVVYLDERDIPLYPSASRVEGELLERALADGEFRFVDDPAAEGQPYVTSYHIDTEIGLRLFANIMKKHDLC